MTVDGAGRRHNYVWHDMPEEVRRDLERRRSGGKNPKEERKQNKRDTNGYAEKGANVPPARNDPPENEIIPKVNKAQQRAEEEYPKEEDELVEKLLPQEEEMLEDDDEEDGPRELDETRYDVHVLYIQDGFDQASESKRSRNTIRFRGTRWSKILEDDQNVLETAFKDDVAEAIGIDKKYISNVQFEFCDVLISSFVVRHENDADMAKAHEKLQSYKYPHTTGLYKR
ncbi:uncharacterized protein TM35_000021850 [Trypanosoma theileri]|uniref:Flagellar attachment zone protein 1 conserved domain-containing protein n=1 Tax=Trypanosoma theileri TaxID=67003 RepID=A0A1X0P8F5_9TRYP|nr:uncharacterized protein TM35_000021850 [Trypanosoma theileri]ORC92859.1 hypothetical protein TM35_000021850 [Trypanosoma theileri]